MLYYTQLCMFIVIMFVILSVIISTGSSIELRIVSPPSNPVNSFRIVGGNETSIEMYPFVAQLLYNSQFYCGGSLITTNHVLTAAHCILVELTLKNMSVVVGSTYLKRHSKGQIFGVCKVAVHQKYNTPMYYDNDVAVVFLKAAVELNNSTQVAALPTKDWQLPDDAPLTLLGWGVLRSGSRDPSPVLRHVTVLSINRKMCNQLYRTHPGQTESITRNMFCGGILQVGGKDACQSDSGGPVVYEGVVVGITSWGTGCADAHHPGVSVRVSGYIDWIERVIEERSINKENSLSAKSTLTAVLSKMLILVPIFLVI